VSEKKHCHYAYGEVFFHLTSPLMGDPESKPRQNCGLCLVGSVMKLEMLRTLYIKKSVGYTPKGAGKKSFLSDYQKRKPPVK
jgi:hypothetical protein